MAQKARINSSWPGGSRNRAGKITLKFKDSAPPTMKFDTGGVQYVVTPGEDDFKEVIKLSACILEDRKFHWEWIRTAGQNHVIRIAFTADSPSIGINDLGVTRTSLCRSLAI